VTQSLIYFVRHGETDWNAERRIQGQADTDVNDRGRTQAARNGRVLRGLISEPTRFDWVASPLRRTRETMEIVRGRLDLEIGGYRTDPVLMEVNFGDWQGLTMAEVEAREPGILARRAAGKWEFLPPGENAESYAMLCARMRQWLSTVSKPTLCVTHGGNMRTLFHMIGGMEGDAAAALDIPQDRVLKLADGRLRWL
jgi:broad specificity phosphatase PhoE